MTKMANLAGVARNIAHHSASGLSFISPHSLRRFEPLEKKPRPLNCWQQNLYPPKAAELQPLRLTLASLKRTAQELLKKHGFTQDDVLSMVLHATPSPWDRKGYTVYTRAVITANNGRVYDSGWLS